MQLTLALELGAVRRILSRRGLVYRDASVGFYVLVVLSKGV